jgi:transcriptional regulator with XRE-family HTH domain/transposase
MPSALKSQPVTVTSAETVGIAISLQRKYLKLNQQDVADAPGVDRAVISQLERARDDTALLFGVVLAVVNALDIDLELRSRKWSPEGPHPLDPQTSIVELGLTRDTLDRLQAADIHEVGQLGEASDLIQHPELSNGVGLYELVRVLNRRGLSLPVSRRQRVPGERELEIFRLRVVEGLSLKAIAERFGIKSGRVRQLLSYSFGLRGTPPAVEKHKRATTAERRAEELAAAQRHQAELIAAWRAGQAPRDLAEKLGLSTGSVEEVIATAATADDRTARAKVRRGGRARRGRWPTR